MINVQIYGDTEAWLRRAAEESGWTFAELVGRMLLDGAEADGRGLLTQFDERKVELEDVTVLNIG